jgi:hypothetical protein
MVGNFAAVMIARMGFSSPSPGVGQLVPNQVARSSLGFSYDDAADCWRIVGLLPAPIIGLM